MNKRARQFFSVFMMIALAVCGINVYYSEDSVSYTEAAVNKRDEAVIPDGAEYVKGEALVLYKSRVTKKMAKKTLTKSDSDIEVTDLFQFGYGGNQTPKSSQIARTSYNRSGADSGSGSPFSVGVVKSDTLTTEELVKKLNATDGVEAACPNYIFSASAVSVKPLKDYQWALGNDGRDGGKAGCDIKKDAVNIKDKSEKVVVVIDSGVDYEHEDLKDAMWENPFEDSGLAGKHGFDFVNRDDDPMDDYDHGTHCAGIIAGTGGSGNGIEGAAKGSGVKIMALKVLGANGAGDTRGICASYDYVYRAAALGVNIVATSNSYGANVDNTMLYIEKRIFDSLGRLGILTVCAAGNNGMDLHDMIYAPAMVDSEYVVNVAAVEQDDCLAGFSNYGLGLTDIAAPGSSILSSVVHPCYNPWHYDEDKFNETVDFSENYDREDCVDTVNLSNSKRMKAQWCPGEGTGAKGEGSGCLSVTINAAAGGRYLVYLNRYVTEESEQPVYASADLKLTGPYNGATLYYVNGMQEPDGSIDQNDLTSIDAVCSKEENASWTKSSGSIRSSQKAGDENVMAVIVNVMEKGEYTLYIDNVTRSKPNLPDEALEKYAYFKGTSMACPCVAGAVALLAAGYSDDSALARKNRLLSCVRKTEELETKVDSGGTLDLTNCDNPVSVLTGARMNDDGTLTADGYALAGTKLLIDGKEASIRARSDEHIAADASGLENRAVMLSLEKDGVILHERFFHLAVGSELLDESRIEGYELEFGWFGYNEENGVLYGVKDFDVYSGSLKSMNRICAGSGDIDLTGMGESTQDLISASVTRLPHSYPVLAGGTLYTLAYVDYYFETNVVLLAFDQKKNRWRYACDLPDEFRDAEGIALEEYNGGLYFIGGLDTEKKEPVNNVCRYDLATGKRTDVAPLPEKRAFSATAVQGGRLYVTLGGGESAGIRNFIFDGEKWTTSKAVIDDNITVGEYEYSDGEVFTYHDGEARAVKDGIIYFTGGTDGMSLPFKYNTAEDTFENMEWRYDAEDDSYWTTFLMKDKLYIVGDTDGIYWTKGASVRSIPVERENVKPAETTPPEPSPSPAVSQPPAPTSSPDDGKKDGQTIKKPAKGRITKASLKKKKLSVKFKKIKDADGYDVQAASDKKFKKNKKKWRTKKLKIKNKKWTKKKCYVRVRAYSKKKGAFVYGAWSAVKKL